MIIGYITGSTGSTSFLAYDYGEIVVDPSVQYSYYYMKWTPSDATGRILFSNGSTGLSSYSGYVKFGSVASQLSGMRFSNATISTIETNFPNISGSTSSAGMFQGCTSLTAANLYGCQTLGRGTFAYCQNLSQVNLPVCQTIGSEAFFQCSCLGEVYLPDCLTVGNDAFYSCSALSAVYMPECLSLSTRAFNVCSSLLSVNLPKCTYVGNAAFGGCKSLSFVSIPLCEYVGSYAFNGCKSLASLDLPMCSYISANAFAGCTVFSVITLRSTSVCTLYNSNAFDDTPIASGSGAIYVPSSLVYEYQSAFYWAHFSSLIRAINN